MLGRRLLVLIAVFALLGHGVLAVVLFPHAMFEKYPDIAAALAEHSATQLPSDASPLYLLLHVFLPTWVVRALAMMAGTAAAIAVGDLAARVAQSRVAGVTAGLSAAVAGPLVIYEATLEPDALLAALIALAAWAFVSRREKTAAAFAGCAAALRPTTLAVVVILAAAVWLHSRRRALRFTAVAALAFVVPVALVRISLGGAVGSTMSIGQVLAQGNAPESTGGAYFLPMAKSLEAQAQQQRVAGGDLAHEMYRQVAQASVGHPLTAAQSERFWAARAWGFVRLHPGAWLRLELLKLRLLFGPLEFHDIASLADASGRAAPLLPHSLLYPLGCVGLLALALRRSYVVPLCALAVAAPYLVFTVTARYRVLLAPLSCVGIGAFVGFVVATIRTRRDFWAPALAPLCALTLVWPSAVHREQARATRKGLRAASAYRTGDALRLRGNLAAAAQQFQLALTLQPMGVEAMDLRGVPWDDAAFWTPMLGPYAEKLAREPSPALYWDAAVIEEWAGRNDDAIAHFRAAADGGFYVSGGDPRYRVGRLLLERHRFDEALRELEVALQRHPGALPTLAAAEAAAGALGQTDRAHEFHREIGILHDAVSASWQRARALRWAGDPRAALRELDGAQKSLPESAFLRWESGLARLGGGDAAGALGDYARAIRLLPAFPFSIARLDAVVSARLGAAPDDPALLQEAGEHALRRGSLAAAAGLLRAALDRDATLGENREFSAHLFFAEHAVH